MRDAIPALEEFRGLLEAFPLLSAIVEERLTTVAQIAVFRPTSPPSGPGGGSAGGAGAAKAGGEAGPGQGIDEEGGSSVRFVK